MGKLRPSRNTRMSAKMFRRLEAARRELGEQRGMVQLPMFEAPRVHRKGALLPPWWPNRPQDESSAPPALLPPVVDGVEHPATVVKVDQAQLSAGWDAQNRIDRRLFHRRRLGWARADLLGVFAARVTAATGPDRRTGVQPMNSSPGQAAAGDARVAAANGRRAKSPSAYREESGSHQRRETRPREDRRWGLSE